MDSTDELVYLHLLDSDPDVAVDLLRVSTEDLIAMFPDKVAEYLTIETGEEVDEQTAKQIAEALNDTQSY